MPRYKTHTVKTMTKYVEFIREHCRPEDVLFRGQPIDRPLVPKIGRISLCDELLHAECVMMDEFKRRVPPLLDVEPKPEWDWLAIAQQHGMATRLLDWTDNPLAALWFVVEQPFGEEKGQPNFGVIWILIPTEDDYADDAENPFQIEKTKIFLPKHIEPHLVRQAGWFTVHALMKSRKRFVPLENNRAYSSKLTKLRIPPEAFKDMRFDLDRFNVNSAALFPDIDGLCAHIQWVNSRLQDEN